MALFFAFFIIAVMAVSLILFFVKRVTLCEDEQNILKKIIVVEEKVCVPERGGFVTVNTYYFNRSDFEGHGFVYFTGGIQENELDVQLSNKNNRISKNHIRLGWPLNRAEFQLYAIDYGVDGNGSAEGTWYWSKEQGDWLPLENTDSPRGRGGKIRVTDDLRLGLALDENKNPEVMLVFGSYNGVKMRKKNTNDLSKDRVMEEVASHLSGTKRYGNDRPEEGPTKPAGGNTKKGPEKTGTRIFGSKRK